MYIYVHIYICSHVLGPLSPSSPRPLWGPSRPQAPLQSPTAPQPPHMGKGRGLDPANGMAWAQKNVNRQWAIGDMQ